MSSRFCPAVGLGPLVLLLVAGGCQKKGEGEACASDDECESGLVCDKHGGAAGKCYPPHGHGPGTALDAGADVSGSTGGSGGSSGSGGSGGSAGGSGGSTGGSGGSTGGSGGSTGGSGGSAPDSGTAPMPDASTGTDARDSAGGASQACTTYCQCMAQNCAMRTGYPFASPAACLTACAGFTEPQRTCWARYCTMVPMANGSLKMHNCEHAWGEHGLDECQ